MPVSKSIGGLTPNTVSYYRASGSSAGGNINGAILSFTTLQPMLAVTPPTQAINYPPAQPQFQVTSNIYWQVNSNAAWCVPTLSGTGNDTIFAQRDDLRAHIRNRLRRGLLRLVDKLVQIG